MSFPSHNSIKAPKKTQSQVRDNQWPHLRSTTAEEKVMFHLCQLYDTSMPMYYITKILSCCTAVGVVDTITAAASKQRQIFTRHTASTSMYSITFCVHVMSPERHHWKPAVQSAAAMLRMPPPRRGPVTGQPATPASHIRRTILRTPPSPASHRPAARTHPAERSDYVVISRDGCKLVTRVRVMLS